MSRERHKQQTVEKKSESVTASSICTLAVPLCDVKRLQIPCPICLRAM